MNWLSLLIIIFFLFAAVFALVANDSFSKKQKAVGIKVAAAMKTCRICGGIVEPGYVRTQTRFFHFKSDKRNIPIGAVRCSRCGHVDLFA